VGAAGFGAFFTDFTVTVAAAFPLFAIEVREFWLAEVAFTGFRATCFFAITDPKSCYTTSL
jgi:hypothetical protein